MKNEKNKERNYSLWYGLLIGIVFMAILLGVIFVIFINPKNIRNTEVEDLLREEFLFNNPRVHLNLDKDFGVGVVPMYDRVYCKKRFLQQYGKEADDCFITNVTTFSRQNPLITDVECLCKS